MSVGSRAMEGFLARSTYRAIQKHSLLIDRDPAVRAVLVAYPTGFYNRRSQQWTSVDLREDWLASRRAIDDELRALNGQSDWYLPHRSATARAAADAAASNAKPAKKGRGGKKGAKGASSSPATTAVPAAGRERFLSGEVASRVRQLYRESPLSVQNLNNAFAAVKMLSRDTEVRRGISDPSEELILPDPRNLAGFEVLPNGVAPMNHPMIAGEAVDEGPNAAALAEARAIAAKSAEAEAEGGKPEGDKAEAEIAKGETASASDKTPTPAAFGLQLLVAHPLMTSIFRHSIVMLSQAGPGGALGFIINKPVINDEGQLMPVWAFIPDTVHPLFTRHLRNNVVMLGGPVSSPASRRHALFVLHRIGGLRGSIELGEGVYTTNDFDAVHEAFEQGAARPEDVAVLLGYCGWGDAQLEEEERRGSWVVLRRPWDARDSKGPEGFTSTADYVFSKNIVVDPAKNGPRAVEGRLTTAPPGTPDERPIARSTEQCVNGEPRHSWVSLFGSLGPEYRAMARLADVVVNPYYNPDDEPAPSE